MRISREQVRALLYGLAVGDALGLPVELKQRAVLEQGPVTGLLGHGTHDQPLGTWSDDSALAFGQAAALVERIPAELDKLAADTQEMLLRWYEEAEWTAHGKHFDMSLGMRSAMMYIESGVVPAELPEFVEHATGNEALVRSMPLALMLVDRPDDEVATWVTTACALTHPNAAAQVAAVLTVQATIQLLKGATVPQMLSQLRTQAEALANQLKLKPPIVDRMRPITSGVWSEVAINDLNAAGDALDTLILCLACLAPSADYASAVLRAVNLGDDSDTNAALVGGLAGLAYGMGSIPADWVRGIVRSAEVGELADQLALALA